MRSRLLLVVPFALLSRLPPRSPGASRRWGRLRRRGVQHLVRQPAAHDPRLGPLVAAVPRRRRLDRLQGHVRRSGQDRHPGHGLDIEQAIADGADGIITCPLDPAAFADVIAKAKEAGAVVASIGCVDLENADFSVGTDNAAYGQVAADFIAEATDGKGQVGILGTDQTTPNQVIQVEAFKEHIAANYPDMAVVTGRVTTATPASPPRRSRPWCRPIPR